MANGFAHAVMGATAGFATALAEKDEVQANPELLIAAPAVGLLFGKSPDVIEPAFKNPNHRQFFHSIAFACAVGFGLKKVYDWEPEDGFEKAIRLLTLCAGIGYLSHLMLDATTPKSLPLIGKL